MCTFLNVVISASEKFQDKRSTCTWTKAENKKWNFQLQPEVICEVFLRVIHRDTLTSGQQSINWAVFTIFRSHHFSHLTRPSKKMPRNWNVSKIFCFKVACYCVSFWVFCWHNKYLPYLISFIGQPQTCSTWQNEFSLEPLVYLNYREKNAFVDTWFSIFPQRQNDFDFISHLNRTHIVPDRDKRELQNCFQWLRLLLIVLSISFSRLQFSQRVRGNMKFLKPGEIGKTWPLF